MVDKLTIVDVTPDNINDYPQVICFINTKNEHYKLKIEWLKKRFEEGLAIKLLFPPGEKKAAGFIEYVPGEYAWRAVEAKDWFFIHCLWVYPNKNKNKGYGTALVDEVVKEAEKKSKAGVAVVASSGSFMAKEALFLKNDFKAVQEADKFQLLVKQLKKGAPPEFKDYKKELQKYRGFHIVYSKQCPWVARFVEEVAPLIKQKKLDVKFTELQNAKEAQSAPSIYSAFNLIKDGKLLADRYISTTRFLNIVNKTVN